MRVDPAKVAEFLRAKEEDLGRRTPEAEAYYQIRHGDQTSFNIMRPVVIMRTGSNQTGVILEYSGNGGRIWNTVSTFERICEAIDAFYLLPHWKDRNPRHYRILRES